MSSLLPLGSILLQRKYYKSFIGQPYFLSIHLSVKTFCREDAGKYQRLK